MCEEEAVEGFGGKRRRRRKWTAPRKQTWPDQNLPLEIRRGGDFWQVFVKPSNLTWCAAKTCSCKMFGTAANEIAFEQLEHGGRLASISP